MSLLNEVRAFLPFETYIELVNSSKSEFTTSSEQDPSRDQILETEKENRITMK